MPRARLLGLLPCLTFGCSLVAGFEEFSVRPDVNEPGGGAGENGNAGASAGAGKGGSGTSAGGTSNANGGTASGGTGEPAAGGSAGSATASGGAGATDATGGSGAGGGLVGNGGEAGLDGAGGADPSGGTSGATAGGAGQGGSSGTAGSGGFSGEATCGELLVNGDFDQGPTPEWQEYVSYSDTLRLVVPNDDEPLVREGVQAWSGNYLAWLGGIPDSDRGHRSRLHQLVRIPANTSRLVFSGRRWIKTVEEPDADYDHLYAQMVRVDTGPSDSFVIDQFVEWTNRDSNADWMEFSIDTTELDDLRNQTLTLEVYSATDPEYKTSFFLDSLSLYAECDR